MYKVFGLIALISVSLIYISDVSAEPISIELKETVHLKGTDICLGDVARIQSGDSRLVGALEQIHIGDVPQLETGKRTISMAEVLMRMRKIGIDADSVSFTGPSVATIYPELQTIPADRLLDLVTGYIRDTMPWDDNDVLIHPQRMPDDVEVVCGKVTYDVIPLSRNQYIGPSRFTLVVNVDGQIQKSVDMFLDITVFKEILVARENINRGDMITPRNIMLVRKELRANTQDAVSDPTQVLGMVAGRTINAQGIIKPEYVEMPVVIRRRDLVKVIVNAGGLFIQARGVAKENGCVGDFIKVENIDSNKIFYAQVTGLREVTLNSNPEGRL